MYESVTNDEKENDTKLVSNFIKDGENYYLEVTTTVDTQVTMNKIWIVDKDENNQYIFFENGEIKVYRTKSRDGKQLAIINKYLEIDENLKEKMLTDLEKIYTYVANELTSAINYCNANSEFERCTLAKNSSKEIELTWGIGNRSETIALKYGHATRLLQKESYNDFTGVLDLGASVGDKTIETPNIDEYTKSAFK